MKKVLLMISMLVFILGCKTREIQTMEDKGTGDKIVFVRSKAPAVLEGQIETDKKTILTFVVGRNESVSINASKFIVTRVKTDSISGPAFETKNDWDNSRTIHVFDTGYTIDLAEIRVSDGENTFKKSNIVDTEKEFHTLGVPTGISFVNYNLSDEEVVLLYNIYQAKVVYLSVTDSDGKVYSGEVSQNDEIIKVLELMKK